MADGQEGLNCSNDDKDLEEGEIDDLEEGEIHEDIPGTSEYRFDAREEKSSNENDLQTRLADAHTKSQNVTNYQRNSARNTKYPRNNDERRTGKQYPRAYEKATRNRGGFKQKFTAKRPHEIVRFDKHVRKPAKHETQSGPRGHQNFDTYTLEFENNELMADLDEDVGEQSDDEDFENLLEKYKHIQEELDELGAGSKHVRSLVDDIIDDSFVDVPLDDVRNAKQPQDNLDAEIRRLELDFSQTNNETSSENPVHSNDMKYPQSIPTTYSNNEPLSGPFEPFQIKPNVNKVRTLSELNKIDLAARGISVDNSSTGKITNDRGQPKGKSKGRRRPKKNERRRMKRKESSSKVSSSDIYEELGVGIKKTNGSQAQGNNGTIMIRKQKLKEWQRQQGVGKGHNVESFGDDYIQTPMEVETDSTEGIDVMEESNPPLPLVDIPQPPPPGEEMEMPSGYIMPLMDVKPYGYFHDYGSQWWGEPEPPVAAHPFFGQATTMHDVLPTSYENFEIPSNENYNAQTPGQNSRNEEKPDETEQNEAEDDEASELALREQLLKSMVNKRAAKNAGKIKEKSAASSVASPGNSRASSPFLVPGTRNGIPDVAKSTSQQTKVNIAPPKHEPVVIHIGEDSEDSDDEAGESPIKESSSFFGGLDMFLKEARERSSKPKPEVTTVDTEEKNTATPPTTPTTPEVVSVLSEEKRNEYKKLKLQLALKKQQQQLQQQRQQQQQQKGLGVTKQDNIKEPGVKGNDNLTIKRKQMPKQQNQKAKQNLPTHSVNRQLQQSLVETQTQAQQQQKQQFRQQEQQQRPVTKEQQQLKQVDSIPQQNSNNAENDERKLKVKILSEMLIGHKRLLMQDQKLQESCRDQLSSSSKALEEHETRVSLLHQQLQRAERLKKVQQDLVEKLQIQNKRLSQRMLKRQSDARELEERLLRTRALLVSQRPQKGGVVTTGEKSLADVKPATSNPRQDTQDGVVKSTQSSSKAFDETREKCREMSRILEESTSAKKKEAKSSQSPKKDSLPKPNPASQREALTEDKLTLEKKRLRILEQKLSQRLRQSDARRKIENTSASPRKTALQREGERASSDSELLVKKNTSSRGLTPPVNLVIVSDTDEGDGGLRTQSTWNVFTDDSKLQKVKRFQAERESSGPRFSHISNKVALPARFSSTKCAWLGLEDISLSQHLDDIAGCLSAMVASSGSRTEVIEQKQSSPLATGPYRSPLVYFRSYRFSPYYRTKKGYTLDSLRFTHLINPKVSFCPFALQGICSDPECTKQHPDDVIPKSEQILQDLAAYFAPARKKDSGDDDVIKAINSSTDAVTKQYGDKVSPAELRVLFVNHLRKQKSAGVHNIVLKRRPWRPSSQGKNDPGTNSQEQGQVVQTESSFSWKSWKRRIEKEIKTRTVDRDECQEIRYFSENYDSVKTLEKATQENPSDESLWIRLAMVHMGSSRTEGDKNNNGRKNVDKALNTLAQALECNRHSEKLWLKYLDVFRQRATTDEIHEVCEEAAELAGSYNVWWAYLDIAMDYNRKINICLKCIEYLILSETEDTLKSHRLLEIFLYLVHLDLHCDCYSEALDRFQAIFNFAGPRDNHAVPQEQHEILASLVVNVACEDLCLLWLCYIHLVEFACLPRDFYDPARSGPSRIVRKDGFVFPWKRGGGTRHSFAELLKLFHRALKECAVVCGSPDKVSPVFWLYENLIALEMASERDASAIRTCQRLLKASPKKIELWLCMAALQQVSGHDNGVVNVYKKALETCDGHAQIAYCAAKYFIEKKNREDCYEALATCVYSKFVLEVPSPGPTTRARSNDQPTILQPKPELLYKKLLSQTLPLSAEVPSAKPGVRPGHLGSEGTYIWLCYCMFIELFSDEVEERLSRTQGAYESAIYSTGDRHEVKTLWTEYLYYMARRLKEKLSTSEELHDVFHKCISTVPAVTPVRYMPSKSWPDYSFHNEVLALYRRCLGDSLSSNVYDKYLEMFPENSLMAIQAVEQLYENKEMNKARKILSAILLKTPYCLELWKIAISIELKEQNFDQARQLFEHATEALPLATSIWKDFATFELSHGSNNIEGIETIVRKAKERGIDLEEFLKALSSKDK